MARVRSIVTVGVAVLTAATLATPPASAATTTIRKGSATGGPYTGNVQATLLGDASVTTSLGGGSCNQSTMSGSIGSDGTGLNIAAASISNDPGPACPGGGGTVTVTTEALPWSGGGAVFDDSHAGGRDAAVTIAGFRVKAVASILGGITCYYGGSLTANGFNPDNPARTDASVAEAQVSENAAEVQKQDGDGASFLCPATASVTANYKLMGESTPGSGVFDQTLYITS